VHGELILKQLREAGIAVGSESANGTCSLAFGQLAGISPEKRASWIAEYGFLLR